MFAFRGFRLTALFATLVIAFSMVAVDAAQARRGGSFGNRGIRTERVIPATPVSPKVTTPVQRSVTDTTTKSATSTGMAARPSLFGGFGGAVLGGLLFSGLFGMMFGYGFGGMGGMLALLVQVGLVGLVLAFLFRRRPSVAGVAGLRMPADSGFQAAGAPQRSNASRRAGRRDEIGISDADLGEFERRLRDLQAAYSREDEDSLRRIATPAVCDTLAAELRSHAAAGVRNEVIDVRLLEGDIAEAWREGSTDFATVAMRYESRDLMRSRSTGELVAGEDGPTEVTEIWTFRRQHGGAWLISAIQEA